MAEEQTRELPRLTEEPKLSPAELKKRAKAEKQARRAAQKDEAAGGPPATLGGANQTESDGQQNRVSGNIVLCESVKFSGKVALDSIVLNEVAPPEELLPPLPRHHHHHHLAPSSSSSSSSSFTSPTIISTGKGTSTLEEDEEQQQQQQMVGFKSLRDWKDIPNLQILNLMYDITPADYISIVVTEYGSLPPSSIPVVHALANGGL